MEVRSAEEARMGLDAMRYMSEGGTRPDRVGDAPAYWDMTESEYRAKADPGSYTHLRAHENALDFVCRRLLEKNKNLLSRRSHLSTHHYTPII